MEAEITSESGRPPTTEVAAAALLGSIGVMGVFGPFAVAASFGLVMGGIGGFDTLLRMLAMIPIICLLALVAALAMYRRAPLARRLGLAVASVLVLGYPVLALLTGGAAFDGGDLVGMVAWHAFLVLPDQHLVAQVAVVAGTIVLALLLVRTHPPREREPTKRPRLAMLLLVGTGVTSTAPYLAWLAASFLALPVAASGGSPGTVNADPSVGVAIFVPSLLASVGALSAARAIRSRAPYSPYVAPAAALMAGPWSALWVLVFGVNPFYAANPGEVSELVAVPALAFFATLIALALATFFIVTASVLRRRDWFLDRPPDQTIARRPGRFWSVSAGLAAAAAVPLVVAAVLYSPDPLQPGMKFGSVRFQERDYRHVAPLEVSDAGLVPAGILDAWTGDLFIDPDRADVFALPGISTELAIAVRGGRQGSSWPMSLFLASAEDVIVPPEACQYVAIEDPEVLFEPCLPISASHAGIRFDAIGGTPYAVVFGDLDPLGTAIETSTVVDDRVDLRAYAIRDVPTNEAVAILVGERILLFTVRDRMVGGELCRYSALAMANPLAGKGDFEGEFPYACAFPDSVAFLGREYARLERDVELLDVPLGATVPIGEAQALQPDGGGVRLPFPATSDPTVYSIAGVDPSEAIAFRVGDRVILFVIAVEGEGSRMRPGLCPYLDPVLGPDTEFNDTCGGT